jgi:hypothetical protein
MGTILDEVEEQRRKKSSGGELEPFWMKGYLMTLYLLIDGHCPCPHPMEPPLIPPDGINPQSSTPTADFLGMNVEEPNLPLHALILRLPHGPDSVTPNRVPWQVPLDSVLVHHHPTTPILPLITPTPRKSSPDL